MTPHQLSLLKDEELIKIAHEESEAFALIIDRYEKKLRLFVRRTLFGYPRDVDDVLQNAFLRMYRYARSFDSKMNFSSWAYRITQNECFRFMKKMKNQPDVIKNDEDGGVLDSLVDAAYSEEDQQRLMEKKIDHQAVYDILKSLKPRHKQVLILKFLEDKSYQEISDILAIPMGTVATLVSRAKKEFREKNNKDFIYIS